MATENTGKNAAGGYGPIVKKPTGGAYPAQGYNYSYGTRTPYNPSTYTRLPGVGRIPAPAAPGGGGSSRTSGGSRSGGGGGGGYGGYNDGPSAYELWRIEEEKRKAAELAWRKAVLTNELTAARDQARGLLPQYGAQYQADIGNIFNQNQARNSDYSQQLQAIQGQLGAGTRGTQDMLARDMQGQGAGAGDVQAMNVAANQSIAGTDLLSLLAQQYNTRLAQVMSQRQADAQSMGSAIQASSQGQLENSYASLLAQIGMIGLQ
jgi:hypothetical protein